MKKRILFTFFTVLMSFLTFKTNFKSFNCDAKQANTINTGVSRADSDTVTMKDISQFLKNKQEHYPLSDEFIERYQQESGGYIDNALEAGLTVDKQLHEPNQKWHFFESWLYPSIEDNTLSWEDNAKTRVYNNLKCPELLLWIYEACEVNPNKVREAKKVAEIAKINKTHIATMAKQMRDCVPWDDIKNTILNNKDDTYKTYSVSVVEGSGFSINGLKNEYAQGDNVVFTVNITDSTKEIVNVKYNDNIITPSSNLSYKFMMPATNVVITVTLKDKTTSDDTIPAQSVSLSMNTLEMFIGKEDKAITATVLPINTTDTPIWSVIQGENTISITSNSNNVTIHAKNVGTAKVKVVYNENVFAECVVNVKADTPSIGETSLAKYNIVYDLGTKKRSQALETNEEVFNTFSFAGQGNAIITSVSATDKMYGGGYGTGWYAGNMLKFGTQSVNGSLILQLSSNVNKIRITGYVNNTSAKIRVGDSNSDDWNGDASDNKTALVTCSNMTVTTQETVENNQTSTIEIEFAATQSLKIATTNSKPLYITAIEFFYCS